MVPRTGGGSVRLWRWIFPASQNSIPWRIGLWHSRGIYCISSHQGDRSATTCDSEPRFRREPVGVEEQKGVPEHATSKAGFVLCEHCWPFDTTPDRKRITWEKIYMKV